MRKRIVMIGAGSGFTVAIANELAQSRSVGECSFVLMDLDQERLRESEQRCKEIFAAAKAPIDVAATTDLGRALEGARFVITSFAPQRIAFWKKDIEIARRHGVELLMGENGGPAGQIHALRNITIMMRVVENIQKHCPDAVLMNFTNPMSMLCTYLHRHTRVHWMGFCHQVHGSFGVVAEMLGMEPGDLQVITAGINHMNFLLDVRRRGSDKSWMPEFIDAVKASPHWHDVRENVPEQRFTREFLDAFGIYPVGYDAHICEYLQFFYAKDEWESFGYRPTWHMLEEFQKKAAELTRKKTGHIQDVEVWRQIGKGVIPFPKDVAHPYYKENPVAVIDALLTNEPLYQDAMVTVNRGCVSNLPTDAVVDIPVTIIGGRARGLEVGPLPRFAAELCRRQIAIHELVADAAASGDRRLLLEAMCLDPHLRGITTARNLVTDYLDEYAEYLPQFHGPAPGAS